MDDFIAELEKNISKVGADKVWKRKIGDTEIWFSPISLYAQERISEMMNNSEQLGINVLHETKHLMLSFAITGINGIDLRPYRDIAPYFPVVGKDGKTTKVSLDKYLYQKMTSWSGQFIDDAFSVYTDLIETHQKENLANIKFENSKTPQDELKELEERVAELKKELNQNAPEAPPVAKPESSVAPEEPVLSVEFDPFAKIEMNKPPTAVPTQTSPAVQTQASNTQIPDIASKQSAAKAAEDELFSSAPVNPNVIDRPMMTANGPPVINAPVSANPRFNPQR